MANPPLELLVSTICFSIGFHLEIAFQFHPGLFTRFVLLDEIGFGSRHYHFISIHLLVLLCFATLNIDTHGGFVAMQWSNLQQVALDFGITQR